MKALTLTQPYATLMALGEKRVETRSWGTPYRGPLAIHAAKSFPGWAREEGWDFYRLGYCPHPDDLPLGKVIAIAGMVDCRRSQGFQAEWDLEHEMKFGDFTRDRWLWFFEDVELVMPIATRGALGLWEWDGTEVGVVNEPKPNQLGLVL